MLQVCLTLLLGLGALAPMEAKAHLSLISPASRYGPDILKTGPCGISGGERTGIVNYYEPGETIRVSWEESVDHPGHYRIAFDEDGDDDFVDPATMTELYSNETVLLDGIEDKGPGDRDYVATVTLPDVTCDNCTLQVIQVMYDKPPYTTPGNDIYYQCADLVLQVGGAPPDAGIEPDPQSGAGCSVGVIDRTSSTALIGLLLLSQACRLARRRRLPV